jgi:hypothetical protein
MAALINIDDVRDGLKERVDVYTEVFGIALENGFGITDMVSWPVDEKYVLRRETLGNITQPGQTNAINFAPSFYSTSTREGKLKPGKVDVLIDEATIVEINDSFMQTVESSDVDDVQSIAGYNYIMDRLFAQAGAEVDASVYYGELGGQPLGAPAGAFQGGRNLMDGLSIKIDDAITDLEIPASHVVTKSVTISAANVLPQLKLIIDKIFSIDHIRREMRSPRFQNIQYKIFCPTEWEGFIVDAFDSLTYKMDNTLRLNEATGLYEPKKLKNTTLAFRSFMDDGSDEAFFSPTNNLFLMSEKGRGGNDAKSVAKVKVQDKDRGFQILLDWKNDVNFADGRFIVPYKGA